MSHAGPRLILRATLCAATALPPLALAESWKPVTSEEGIDVTERAVPGRNLPVLRAVGTVDANLYQILAVIRDVDRHPEWMHECREARRLRDENERVAYVYNLTDAPWPVADRYVVARSEIVVVEPGREVHVRFRSTEESLPEPPGRAVRMRRLEGDYRLEALGPERTRVEYRVDADPGGLLPLWVVRRTSRELPLLTVIHLRQQAVRTRGEYESFRDRWDPERRDREGRER